MAAYGKTNSSMPYNVRWEAWYMSIMMKRSVSSGIMPASLITPQGSQQTSNWIMMEIYLVVLLLWWDITNT